MGQIQLVLGIPRSGKTGRCLEAYARELAAEREAGTAGNALWLAPAREARPVVLERLLPLVGGVLFQPNVTTFDRFADRVLTETGHEGRAITQGARRLILRHLIRQLVEENRLDYFRRIAGTEGFLDVVVRFISELKRAEIWPDAFLTTCRQRFSSARDAELGLIYDRYQAVLLDKNWYDSEGRFWLARTAMQTAKSGFFRELSLVVVDGFSDFTTTQQEMLEQLAVGSQRLMLTLPIEQPLRRTQLFAKPASMLAKLSAMFSRLGPVETVVCMETVPGDASTGLAATRGLASGALAQRAGSGIKSRFAKPNRDLNGPPNVSLALPAGLRQVHRHLFDNPRDLPRSIDSDGLEIVPAVGEESEKVEIALRIKRLLAGGVSPRDIVVGLRHAGDSGPAWDRYLTSAGIPSWCEVAPPWSRSPYLKALFSILQLEAEDWPFERLRPVLNSSFFRPQVPHAAWNPAESPQRITGWLRRLKLHTDRVAILKGLKRRREYQGADDRPDEKADLEFAQRILHELSETLELARKAHDLAGWADALARITSRLGLAAKPQAVDARDADWLQGLVRSAAAIEAELSREPTQRSLAEFIVFLRDIIRGELSANEVPSSGRVRIVGAETLRHLQAKYVFLVEMTEDAFPSRRADDCLYSEIERLQLLEDGLALSHRQLHQQDEMLLFAQAVTRAGERLTISYSLVNTQGHEVYPSPYVTAIGELFEPALAPKPQGRLDPLPDLDQVITPTDLRLAAVVQARRKKFGWWKHLLEDDRTRPTARNVLAAAETAVQRFHTPGFTPFEGRMSHPRHLAELAERYGPSRQFSATELESVSECGFKFWLSHVLKLESLADPEVVTDYASRGNLVHDVLAKLADEHGADVKSLVEKFRELVAERLQRIPTDDELRQALLVIERELLSRWAEGYGQQHGDYVLKTSETQLTVLRTLKEVPFGAARDADAETPQDRFPPLVLGTDEDAIRIGGRIDRVDISRRNEQTVFTLIDYKTGKPPAFSLKRLQAGEALQLALYALAVTKLGIAGPDAVPLWMGYWSVKGAGFAPAGGKPRSPWTPLEGAVLTTLESILAEIVPQLAARMRTGQFVVENADQHCTSHCEFHTVCRVNQLRPLADRLEKHRPPLAVSPTDEEP